MNDRANEFIRRLHACPPGRPGWREFEDICAEIITFLFVPPLPEPYRQPRTESGNDRRDYVLSNRQANAANNWGQLLYDHNARLIPVEFKNYDAEEIGKDETYQARNYLKDHIGDLAILCCNKEPSQSALQARRSIFGGEHKLVLFITTADLEEMLRMKERGEDPSDLLIDLRDRFVLRFD